MADTRFDGDRPASENCEDEMVAECFGCPGCSERRMDYLAWVGDETVHCTRCGTEYNPNA